MAAPDATRGSYPREAEAEADTSKPYRTRQTRCPERARRKEGTPEPDDREDPVLMPPDHGWAAECTRGAHKKQNPRKGYLRGF